MAKSNRNRNAAPATETPAEVATTQETPVSNGNTITLSRVKLYDNGRASYTADGLKGRIRLSAAMFATKGEAPLTITLSADGLATPNPEEAAKAKERAEKRAARKEKAATTAAERLAKAEEKAKKAAERLEKLRAAAAKAGTAPATEAPAGTEQAFEEPVTQ